MYVLGGKRTLGSITRGALDALSDARVMLQSGNSNRVAADEAIAPFAFVQPVQSA